MNKEDGENQEYLSLISPISLFSSFLNWEA